MLNNMQRESMTFDVLIVGAGPAGLSAAIRLAQLARENKSTLSICVLDKGASVGAHILSGAVLEPRALNELLPDWKKRDAPVHVSVTHDEFFYLNDHRAWRLPTPPTMKNKGNYIISLGKLCEWLAQQAEALGVSVFPGFAASNILYEADTVIGIQTTDQGLDKKGNPSERFQPGMELYAKQTFFAEGCRGSLSEQLITKYHLREHCDYQTYGIGIKELWKVNPKQHQLGKVIHTVGWPLDHETYGGSFIYHYENNFIAMGLVVGLDYRNPYLDPFQEFQRLKTHPRIRSLLIEGECIGFGARALNEGGLQSLPKLTFPGGLLLGCGAGLLNVAKIKGTHTAMKSGMLAAEAFFNTPAANELSSYPAALAQSWIYQELHQARNVRPAFHHGLWAGLCYAALDQFILRGKAPWTFHYKKTDHAALQPAHQYQPVAYPKPDGKLTFDKATQIYLTATKHSENEPCHLHLKNSIVPIMINLKKYDAPEQRYCPANVYEIVHLENQPQLQINAPNCIHCKTCDIKDPTQNIVWVTPEGGDGPNYSNM